MKELSDIVKSLIWIVSRVIVFFIGWFILSIVAYAIYYLIQFGIFIVGFGIIVSTAFGVICNIILYLYNGLKVNNERVEIKEEQKKIEQENEKNVGEDKQFEEAENFRKNLIDKIKEDLALKEKFFNNPFFLNNLKVEKFVSENPFKDLKATIIEMEYEENSFLIDSEKALISEYKQYRTKLKDLIKGRNEQFKEEEKYNYKDLFENIEGNQLNNQQIDAIVNDEDNTLVIAGAGTGKTSTIVGKVKYLLEAGLAQKEDILVLVFNANASQDLQNRINEGVEIKTFNAFGLSTIGSVTGKKPSLRFDKDNTVSNFLNNEFQQLYKNEVYTKKIIEFLAYFEYVEKSAFEFQTLNEYYSYIKSNSLLTLQGEYVKSFEELKIANFLYLNSVPYKYEADYIIDTTTSEKGKYKPDFHFTNTRIYLEHFGIDENGNVPSNWTISSKQYNDGIEWKRQLHKENNTNLLQTYSYQNKQGILGGILKKQLVQNGFELKKRTDDEVFKKLNDIKKIPNFINLTSSLINLMKSSEMDMTMLRQKAGSDKRVKRFLDIFEKLYNAYSTELKTTNTVDFNDMLIQSTQFINEGKLGKKYKYILVDEFQDISVSRYNLIKALAKNNEVKVFAVGDDWQSIYRFTGSDISIMTNFEEHFGYTYQTKIETSFRFNNQIAKTSGDFIQKNEAQLKKEIKSNTTVSSLNEALVIKYDDFSNHRDYNIYNKAQDNNNIPFPYKNQLVSVLEEIEKNIKDVRSLVFIIGRYKNTKPPYFNELNNQFQDKIQLEYHTAHSAKGLTSDHTIILNVIAGKRGFPSLIDDDPILQLALVQKDSFPNAEERRLFYVALTRARHKNYILGNSKSISPFLQELQDMLSNNSEIQQSIHKCPKCDGTLVLRSINVDSEFYGCTHFPWCKGKKNIKIQKSNIITPTTISLTGENENGYDDDLPF